MPLNGPFELTNNNSNKTNQQQQHQRQQRKTFGGDQFVCWRPNLRCFEIYPNEILSIKNNNNNNPSGTDKLLFLISSGELV